RQELPAASEVTQLFEVTAKSPVAVTALISRMPAPAALLSVTVAETLWPMATLPKSGIDATLGTATAPESTSAGTSSVASGAAWRNTGVQKAQLATSGVVCAVAAAARVWATVIPVALTVSVGAHDAIAAWARATGSTVASGLFQRASLTHT